MQGKISELENAKGYLRCNCTTPEGRVSFPSVFQARSYTEGAVGRYQCTLIFSKSDAEAMEFIRALGKRIGEIAKAKWPALEASQIKKCLEDGDSAVFTTGPNAGQFKKDKYPDFENAWVLVCSKREDQGAPAVVGPDMQPIINAGDFYAGCYGRMSFQLYTAKKGDPRVAGGLNNLQKTRDGEPLGNAGSRPEDDFGPVAPPAQGGAAEVATDADIFG
jgi:hypothetical protein